MDTADCCMALPPQSKQSFSLMQPDAGSSELQKAKEVELKARQWLEQAAKVMPVIPIDAQALPEKMRLKAIRVRAWRQRRRDIKLLEQFEGTYPEVRTAEENIRHCMQIWIDKKHKHKKHLRKALQELQNLPVLKDEHIEERTAYLRQCIDELTNESTYVKMCISFWEEILRHRRLEAISKGLSYLSWANKDNASHPNADRTLVALHEQLNALRQARERFVRQLTNSISNREGEHAAEKIVSKVINALQVLLEDDANTELITMLSVPHADSSLLTSEQCSVLEKIRKDTVALGTCGEHIRTYTDSLLIFVNLREELLLRKSEIEERAEEAMDKWPSEEEVDDCDTISIGSTTSDRL